MHDHPWYYYLKMLLFTRDAPGPTWSEALVLVLAAAGAASALSGRSVAGADQTLLRFLALYTVIMTVLYSAIPYKTPWCLLEFLQPMILLAGVGAAALYHWLRILPIRVITCVLLVLGAVHLGSQAYLASFKFSADNRNPYAYAHPLGDVSRLASWLERLATLHPEGRRMVVKVIAPDYWPLPWYLRRFERVGYWEVLPEDPDAPIVIAASEWQLALDARLQKAYKTSHYGLRPGVMLVAYVDLTLWEAFVDQEHSRGPSVTGDQP